MKIAIVGLGKMGKMICNSAENRGHEIFSIDSFNKSADAIVTSSDQMIEAIKNSKADIAIEFTHPSSVISNINSILSCGIPMVVGTTGWYEHMNEVEKLVKTTKNNLFWAGNFSIGVNMFYRIVEQASKLMAEYSEYDVAVWEAHHNQKSDSPSGTAIEIAKRIMANNLSKTQIVDEPFRTKPEPCQLHVSSTRVGSVAGIHKVFFDSPVDTIELTHTAHSREGFAFGAVRAAEWLLEGLSNGRLKKSEIFTMDDFFSLQK
ncbi:MAG: 4-hydroxy-tetrahydrodipicolinate reductase [Treponemataceae bacterium]